MPRRKKSEIKNRKRPRSIEDQYWAAVMAIMQDATSPTASPEKQKSSLEFLQNHFERAIEMDMLDVWEVV